MKKTSMTALTTALISLSSLVGADEGAVMNETAPQAANSHRVYAGPEFMWSHFHGDIENKNKTSDVNLNRNIYYGGLRFGYEYLKPDAFYAATDAVALMGAEKGKVTQGKDGVKDRKLWDRTKEVFRGDRGHFWSNAEQRFGYTFSSSLVPTCTVSVFAGPGFHYEHEKGAHGLWGYATTGLKAVQQFSKHFSLGTDMKVMYAFGANDSVLTRPVTLGKKEFWGYEFGVPFQWNVGESRSFDIQLKPYLLKLNSSSQETILGSRLELGYNF